MNLPDPIERLEMVAENWAYDNIKGGKFLCGCGKWCELEDAETLSSNPYAIPVCPDCAVEWFELRERNKNV